MQNLKYLERVVDEETRFGVILNEIAIKHQEPLQFKMALSLLEYFNQGKFIDQNAIKKTGNLFYVSKEKYFKAETIPISKVFGVRVSLTENQEDIDKKIANLLQKIKDYRNLK